ncbi:MAG: ABC transporter transmembrane domain-containing protein [Pseudomonadota bacterium]
MRLIEDLRALRRSPDIVVASLTVNTLGLMLPLVMIQLYDRVIPNAGYETLAVLGLALGAAILCDAALRLARGVILSRAGARFERGAYHAAISNLLGDPGLRADTAPGALFNELGQIERVRGFHTGDTGTALLDLPFIFLFLGVMIAISPVLGGTVLTLVAAAFLAVRVARNRITALSNDRLERDGRRQSFLMETLGGIEVIKALGAEDFMARRYERLMTGSAATSAQLATQVQRAQGLAGAAGLLAPVAAAGVGAVLVINGQLSIGALAAAVLLTGRIVQPALRVEMLLAGEDDIRGHEATVTKLLSVPARTVAPNALPPIDQVTAHGDPNGGPAADTEFTLRRGDCLLVTGADGRAVTHAMAALAGKRAHGTLRMDIQGRAMETYPGVDLDRRISLISGEYRPLTGTLLENLTRFRPDLYRERALALCLDLGIDQYIAQHPAGLAQKLIGETRDEIPRDVADALAIISALVTEPDVIVFDEAATSFDPRILAALAAHLREIRRQRILFLASARPDYAALATAHATVSDGCLRRAQATVAGFARAAEVGR